MNFVWLQEQFGNQLWELAAGAFFFGRGNFIALTDWAKPLPGLGFDGFLHTRCLRSNPDILAQIVQTTRVKRYQSLPQGTNAISDMAQDRKFVQNFDTKQFLTFDSIQNDFHIVQVRGGDFFSYKSHREFVKGRDWYLKAIESIPVMRKHRDKIVICTNDRNYASKILPEFPILGASPFTEFRLMMGCRSLVSSASTFGWWAGFLNDRAEVVAPLAWCGCDKDSARYYAFDRLTLLDD